MASRVVFRNGGGRFLEVTSSSDGSLTIHGQDFGPEVEEIFGSDEYEWYKSIPRSNIDRCREVFGVPEGCDLMDHLQANFTDDRGERFERLVREHQLAEGFWSWP